MWLSLVMLLALLLLLLLLQVAGQLLSGHTLAKPNAAFSNVRAYTAVSDSWDTRASGSTRNAMARMLRYSCISCCFASCRSKQQQLNTHVSGDGMTAWCRRLQLLC
jgi:hypothetical protein